METEQAAERQAPEASQTQPETAQPKPELSQKEKRAAAMADWKENDPARFDLETILDDYVASVPVQMIQRLEAFRDKYHS